ncbi:class A beta-lactamase [Nocardia wallacei]|uniref:class A beta-lactamase n=1 Tax=Nocardia wallacei TaxID=480035 RepID=UPI002457598F|nr:class A beta-lactamase [Nocardia wallacei]
MTEGPRTRRRDRTGIGRRLLLRGALALPLAACAETDANTTTPTRTDPVSGTRVDPAAAEEFFAGLERKYDARLGVYALATGTAVALAYHADDRFAFCSTFKMPAVAAVLEQRALSYLDTVVRYKRADVNSISPITQDHIETGMTVRELCDAAIRYSDGTAGNLLMRDIGGPAQLTGYLRSLGDTVGRMDQYEPELNSDPPGDPRDTTTPRAIAGVYQQIVLRNALPPEKQALVREWLQRSTTGANTIRAGVPGDWTVANKTGHGDYGRANDIAVVWPPASAPLVLAVMTDRAGFDAAPPYAMIAEVAKYVAAQLHR